MLSSWYNLFFVGRTITTSRLYSNSSTKYDLEFNQSLQWICFESPSNLPSFHNSGHNLRNNTPDSCNSATQHKQFSFSLKGNCTKQPFPMKHNRRTSTLSQFLLPLITLHDEILFQIPARTGRPYSTASMVVTLHLALRTVREWCTHVNSFISPPNFSALFSFSVSDPIL